MDWQHRALWIITALASALQLYVFANTSYWDAFPYSDKLLHLLWGLVTFLILRVHMRWRIKDALLGTIAIALLFEAGEMIDDFWRAQPWWPWHSIDTFYWDGVLDVLTNLLGGLLGAAITLHIREQTKPAPRRVLIAFLICCAPLPIVGIMYPTNIVATAWLLTAAVGCFSWAQFTSGPK